jgi:hypothetical protein
LMLLKWSISTVYPSGNNNSFRYDLLPAHWCRIHVHSKTRSGWVDSEKIRSKWQSA